MAEGISRSADGTGASSALTPATESVIRSLSGGGQSLSQSERSYFEPRFGTDFSGVRLHTGDTAGNLAQSVQANAFTMGGDIVFGRGQYAPGAPEGKRLLAHELTHVVQQPGSDWILRERMVATPSAHTEESAGPKTEAAPRATAAWVALGQEVYAYLVGRTGMTLNDVAAYMTGHPDLPDLLAKVNKLYRFQPLQEGYPVIVPIEYIDDKRQAWADMPSYMRESIALTRQERAEKRHLESFIRVESGHPAGPGAVGPIPITLAFIQQVGTGLSEATFEALKKFGKFIKGIILAPYYLIKSIIAFMEGLIDGLRGQLDADLLEKIINKKPTGILDAVLWGPAYSVGVVKGIIDQGIGMVKGVMEIISDPLGFLESLAKLVLALLTEEGEKVFYVLGEATGKEFAGRIKGLAGESITSFAFGIGEIAGYVLVEIILTMVGAKAGTFALEAIGKLRKIKPFERLVEKLPVKRPKPEVPAETKPAVTTGPKPEPKPEPKLSPIELKAEKASIRNKIREEGAVSQVTDPELSKVYELEIKVDRHTYRRRGDGTWCRFSKVPEDCTIDLGIDIDNEALKALEKRLRRPGWRESEADVGRYLDTIGENWESQVSYYQGKRALPTKFGSVKPDYYHARKKIAVEVKNYDLVNNYDELVMVLRDQAGGRLAYMPKGIRQWVFLDVRGQKIGDLAQMAARISRSTGGVFERIYFLTEKGAVLP